MRCLFSNRQRAKQFASDFREYFSMDLFAYSHKWMTQRDPFLLFLFIGKFSGGEILYEDSSKRTKLTLARSLQLHFLKKISPFPDICAVWIVYRVRTGKGGVWMEWNREYFQEQYERYSGLVYRICRIYLKNDSDAKDGLQEVFLKIWEKRPDFSDDGHARAWIIRTTKNYCLDVLKSSWHAKRAQGELDENVPGLTNQVQDTLSEKLMKLPAKQRIALYLYYYEEYSIKEISHILKVRQSTIQSRLAAGRLKLKTMLQKGKGDGYGQKGV